MRPVSELKHLNEGECADIYEIDAHTVLKLGKPGWSKEQLYQEYRNGKRIAASNIPAPKVYEFVEADGRYGYTMARLHDVTLLDLLWKHPGKFIAYAKKLAAIHAQIHRADAPEELPLLTETYSEFIALKESISDEKKQAICRDIERFSAGSACCICHGDFHPINILMDGDEYSVIDWVLATRGNPESDVAGTYLITRVYSLHIGGKNLFRHMVSMLGGSLLAKIYLREYIAITHMDRQKILRWIPVRAATYLDVGLPERLERIFRRIMEKGC